MLLLEAQAEVERIEQSIQRSEKSGYAVWARSTVQHLKDLQAFVEDCQRVAAGAGEAAPRWLELVFSKAKQELQSPPRWFRLFCWPSHSAVDQLRVRCFVLHVCVLCLLEELASKTKYAQRKRASEGHAEHEAKRVRLNEAQSNLQQASVDLNVRVRRKTAILEALILSVTGGLHSLRDVFLFWVVLWGFCDVLSVIVIKSVSVNVGDADPTSSVLSCGGTEEDIPGPSQLAEVL